jgi:hypothetical protein
MKGYDNLCIKVIDVPRHRAACRFLGTSISAITRTTLDNTIDLAIKMGWDGVVTEADHKPHTLKRIKPSQ